MKSLLIGLLLLAGCAYVPPKHITEVSVRDVVVYQSGTHAGCTMDVLNILTVYGRPDLPPIRFTDSVGEEGALCGDRTCGSKTHFTCTEFSYVVDLEVSEPTAHEVLRQY